MLGVFLSHSLPYISRQCISANSELISSSSLARQLAHEGGKNSLTLPLQFWDYSGLPS